MLIMTQRKEEIVNIDNVQTIFEDQTVFTEQDIARFGVEYVILAQGVNGMSVTLGRYKSEERAKEVLREISEEYRIPGNRTYEMPKA